MPVVDIYKGLPDPLWQLWQPVDRTPIQFLKFSANTFVERSQHLRTFLQRNRRARDTFVHRSYECPLPFNQEDCAHVGKGGRGFLHHIEPPKWFVLIQIKVNVINLWVVEIFTCSPRHTTHTLTHDSSGNSGNVSLTISSTSEQLLLLLARGKKKLLQLVF